MAPPSTTIWLGTLGVVPFVALSVAAWFAPAKASSIAVEAVVAYGAVILSFIGGAHWGFASRNLSDHPSPLARRLLILSVMPSLVGWLALLLALPWSPALLALAFAIILPLDRWACAIDHAPNWWMRLRLPLSASVAVLLGTVSLAALVRFGDGAIS